MSFYKHFCITTISLLLSFSAIAQQRGTISGQVTDSDKAVIPLVNVAIQGYPYGIITDDDGHYSLTVPSEKKFVLVFSYIGYKTRYFNIYLKPNEQKEFDVSLEVNAQNIPEIEIRDKKISRSTLNRIDPKAIQNLPSASGSISEILLAQGGVVQTNELSSQYNVRGGNFDENLIYVNGYEIYKPQLVRSGQQEGLSFVNPEMVGSLMFSAGGFPSKYGDKLSSVLDVKYKNPEKFGGSVDLNLLSQNITIGGATKNKKLNYIAGFRRKSTSGILNTLDTKGDYKPKFLDFQALVNYDLSDKWSMSALGYYSDNTYQVVPTSKETSFGTVNNAKQLKTYFDGNEKDQFKTLFGGYTLSYKPSNKVKLDLILSGFQSTETEYFDIYGEYFIGELDSQLGSENFGNITGEQGIGAQLRHARNRLYIDVFNIAQHGEFKYGKHNLEWQLKYQNESIDDKISEWTMFDSLGYNIPDLPIQFGKPNPERFDLKLKHSLSSKAKLQSHRITGYLQNSFSFITEKQSNYTLNIGLRASYWDINKEFFITPRIYASYTPYWDDQLTFKLATGLYYQPPFYREIRDMQGELNRDVKSQKSWQISFAAEKQLTIWERPFKISGELYYKYLWDINPYTIDNVRIKYQANNKGIGYATGLDFRINGEFIPGVESYASLSLLNTRENIADSDFYEFYNDNGYIVYRGKEFDGVANDSLLISPGYTRRPSDQLLTAAIFFQDNLPIDPTFKVHLKFVFGTRLPVDVPNTPRAASDAAGYELSPYRRVDLGFSKEIISDERRSKKSFLRHIKSMSVHLEVFNLFDINNVISYEWFQSYDGRSYAIPNYLTSRYLNVRLITRF